MGRVTLQPGGEVNFAQGIAASAIPEHPTSVQRTIEASPLRVGSASPRLRLDVGRLTTPSV